MDELADSLGSGPMSGRNYEIENLVYDIREIGSYVFGNGRNGHRSRSRRSSVDIKDVLIDAGIHLALVFVLDRLFDND